MYNDHDCIFDKDQMYKFIISYWRTHSDLNIGAHVILSVYSGFSSDAFIWRQSLKHCSNTENGIVVCWSLEESPYLLWSITSSGSHLSTGRAGTISSSESSTQPANKDKMTWKSGKEMHFVMDNIEIWKTTCEPSILP